MTVLALRSNQAATPGLDSIVEPTTQDVVAQVWTGNPIADESTRPPLTQNLVCWSGWCGPLGEHGVPLPNVHTWSAPGWEAFERVAIEMDREAQEVGVDIIIRPHARHVLADPQCTLAWLKRTEPKRLKVLLDPVAWLTPGMLDAAEDHLGRAFESFTGHPAVWGTVLSSVREVSLEGGPELLACPLGSGVLKIEQIEGALGGYDLGSKPIVVTEEGFEAQKALVSGMTKA